MALDQVGSQLIMAVRVDRDRAGFAVIKLHVIAVAGIAGVGHQHFLARIQARAQGQQKRAGRAGRHKDAADRDRHSVFQAVECRDFFSKFGQARRRRVFDVAGRGVRNRRLQDRLRRHKIRLADFHVNDVSAFGFQFLRTPEQFHHIKRLNARNSLRYP